ncbi:MAG: NADH:ubiquinone oxidoreductase subunit NDUFA12, partial [Rhodovarius sp.]|nr:NADH:ubiquinone oxidoreductase subunit NDUFA12 [Rhodovarius sp.]
PNLTGTPFAWRPRGHDYAGGRRRSTGGDYEAWTPPREQA